MGSRGERGGEDEPLTLSSILKASQSPIDLEKQKSLFTSLFNSHSRSSRRPKPIPTTVSADSVIKSTVFNKKNNPRFLQRLLSLRKEGDLSKEFSELAIETLMRKLRRSNDLDELEKAIRDQSVLTKCVTIPRTHDGRVQVSNQKLHPHVLYCRLWRWPDLMFKHELYSEGCCKFGYNRKLKEVCVNPYHYERVENSYVLSSPQTINSPVSSINSNARSSLEELINRPFNYNSTEAFSPTVNENWNYRTCETSELVTSDPLGLDGEPEGMVKLKSEFHVSVEILRRQNEYADVHLVGQDGFVPVHGYILQYFSSFVDALFAEEKENTTEVRKILLPDFTVTSLQKIVQLIYSGETTIDSAPEAALILDFLNILNIDHNNFSYCSTNLTAEGGTTNMNEIHVKIEDMQVNEWVEIDNDSSQSNSNTIIPSPQTGWAEPLSIENEATSETEYLHPPFHLSDFESRLECQDRMARENAFNNKKNNTEDASTIVDGSEPDHIDRWMDAVIEISSSSSEASLDGIPSFSSKNSKSDKRKRKPVNSTSDCVNTNFQSNRVTNPSRLSSRARGFPAPIRARESATHPISSTISENSNEASNTLGPISLSITNSNSNVPSPMCSPSNTSHRIKRCYVPRKPRHTDTESINPDANPTSRDCSGENLLANLELSQETAMTCLKCKIIYSSPTAAAECIKNHKFERCYFCMKLFESQKILHWHYAESHGSKCPLCDEFISRRQGTAHALICVDKHLFPSGRNQNGKRQATVHINCPDPKRLIRDESSDHQFETDNLVSEEMNEETEIDPELSLLEPPPSVKDEFEASEIFSYENTEVWS